MNGNEVDGGEEVVKMEECKEDIMVYMWGYLPGASPEKSPILSPVPVRLPGNGDSWKDVCGGGCGFAMAISVNGKLITWGSVEDETQIYLTSGKHSETPEPFPLPTEASVVKAAAAGWAHCVSVTETGEVFTWGWKECIPSGKIICDLATVGCLQKDTVGKQSSIVPEQGNLRSQGSSLTAGAGSHENKKAGEEVVKKRKITQAKQESENLMSSEEFFAVSPSIVTLGAGIRIITVAAGGRHTLALSDMGQVWGWGYGGEGQLGLGSRVKMVSTPHLIPCIDPTLPGKDRSSAFSQDSKIFSAQSSKVPGSFIKAIACGGRHSAVITDAGALLTFGWGLYGQCGQGGTYDQLRPTYVNSLSTVRVEKVAAGLWHTLCVSDEGLVYAFGGNQFGQLGTGTDQIETVPKLLDSSCLEGKNAKMVSCGARHSIISTEDGELFSWGWNKYGQLGLGDSVDRGTPSQVTRISGVVPINIACGWWHTLMLAETPN